MYRMGAYIFVSILMLLNVQTIIAQQGNFQVSGTVIDITDGEPLVGVNVIVQGETIGTSTDQNGEFSLTVPSDQSVLVFSYIGYERKIIAIEGRETIDVELTSLAFLGEDLVVVGYGERSRETLTGAISRVSATELQSAPVSNLSQNIGGRIPGVITVNSSGAPGADDAIIRIRGEHTLGDNNPLIVIDGIPNRSGGLDRLNPRDIVDVTVLKDASAAIYGSQAANGVILVTTRRGREGTPQVNMNFNQGISQPTRLPDMADAPTYMTMINELNFYRDRPPRFSEDEINLHADPSSDPWLYPNTDWFAQGLKPVSNQTIADISLSGGSESLRYYLSLSGLTEDGFYENSSHRYNQLGFRSNIDGQLSDNISLKFDIAGRLEDRNFPTVSSGNTFEKLVRGFPNQPGFWPSGHPGPSLEGDGQNPVMTGSSATGYDHDERYFLQSNVQLNIVVPQIDGLSISSTIAYDRDFLNRKRWATPWTLFEFDRDTYISQGGDPVQYLSGSLRGLQSPELTEENRNGNDLLLNLVGNYQQNFQNHSFGILLGTEYQRWENTFFSAFRTNFISSSIDQFFAGGTTQQNIDGSAIEGVRMNFFSRLNYDYDNKYLIEFVARYDGSYIFPPNQRYGFFPAVSVGWRLTEENWFTDFTNFFDEFKIRASLGQTGNDRIQPFQHLDSFAFGLGYVFNVDQEMPSLVPTQTPNPDVTWEVATQFDIGIESIFFDNRLRAEFDYFRYNRDGILTQRNAEVPRSTGLILPDENIGEVDSWGFDGSLALLVSVREDWNLNLTLIGGYATNEIKYWDEPAGVLPHQQSTGSKMRAPLMYIADGVFETWDDIENHPSWPGARPGDIRFRDVTGDGEITPDDRVRLDRNNIPEWIGGLRINSQLKQFDFTIFFQGAAGAAQYVRTASGEFGNYYRDFAENRWRPDNPNKHTPRAFSRQDEYWMSNNNTYFYENTDYIRLKNLEIGYTLPVSTTTGLGLSNLRVYANGFNLLTWSSYIFGDPEAASAERGGVYPQRRIFNAGLSLSF